MSTIRDIKYKICSKPNQKNECHGGKEAIKVYGYEIANVLCSKKNEKCSRGSRLMLSKHLRF